MPGTKIYPPRSWSTTLAVVSLIVLIGVLVWVLFLLRVANNNAQLSCLSAIANSALPLATASPPTALGKEWRVLSDLEAKSLLSRIVPYDCPNNLFTKTATRSDGTLVDAWGRQFKVALRAPEKGTVNIRVWSMGRDGRSGTDDDLVIPWGEKALKP